ncbi:hypothetical protein MBLNU459_g2413t2 [Dothideomycetes sp. NU459]
MAFEDINLHIVEAYEQVVRATDDTYFTRARLDAFVAEVTELGRMKDILRARDISDAERHKKAVANVQGIFSTEVVRQYWLPALSWLMEHHATNLEWRHWLRQLARLTATLPEDLSTFMLSGNVNKTRVPPLIFRVAVLDALLDQEAAGRHNGNSSTVAEPSRLARATNQIL